MPRNALFFFLFPFFLSSVLLAAVPLQGRRIVIDAGHGTINYDGKIINGGKEIREGEKEHALNVDIAMIVGDHLKKLGAEIFYTRTKADYWRFGYNTVDDNKTRAIFANALKADALISLHCDWHPNKRVHGVTTLYEQKNARKLAQKIQKEMVRSLKAKDRRAVNEDFTILGQASMPAVIVETGFMSHKKEAKKLLDSQYREKVGFAIGKGLVQFFRETTGPEASSRPQE